MNFQEDLWGDMPEVEKVRTPLNILSEQAKIIGEKSNNLIEGNIILRSEHISSIDAELSISVPTLGYSANIVRIIYKIEMYPVRVINSLTGLEVKALNEDEYKKVLREVFNSEQVRKLLSVILTQIRATEK